MLSRGKITPGRARYYSQTVAAGLDDYLSGHGEAPGQWEGTGAARAGLSGEVIPEHMARLFDSGDPRHPLTGLLLGMPYRVREGADKVVGWDLTLSAPKSFSALWAVAGPELGQELAAIHLTAVREAIAYLEEHAAFTRQGRGGVAQVDTDGLVIARFDHRTSRAGDPQKHSHLLVSARVRRPDGKWRALDSKALHAQLKPAGMVYQAALRAEARSRLGLAWGEASKDGQAEILGVPEELVRHWSKRRRSIVARARRRIANSEVALGRALTDAEVRVAYQKATLEDRPAKGGASAADVHTRWRTEAADVGLAVDDWLPGVFGNREVAAARTVDSIMVSALAELERSQSTWGRAEVVGQMAKRLPPSFARTSAEARMAVEALADRALAHAQVVRLAGEELPPVTGLKRRDGRSVFTHHAATRYTTRTTLAREARVLDFAEQGRHAEVAIAAEAPIEELIASHGLDAEQAAVVRRLTRGGEALVCLVGPAGTGKTRTVGAAADIWNTDDIPVRGLTVSARAAGVLAAEAGIPADTLAKLLHEYSRPGGARAGYAIHSGEVLVLDEASQVSSADFARLVDLAEAAGAKIVAVGDYRQLGSVNAGGLFRLLAKDTAAVELTGVWRFSSEWERAASLRLRNRDASVLRDYDEHGRIHGGTREETIEAAFARWLDARAAGESVVAMAPDHYTVDAFALRVRAVRARLAEVEPGGIELGEQIVGAGDEIVTTRNDRRLVTDNGHWVRNGDRWTVERRTSRGHLRVRSLEGRGHIWL
ncbi:MAG: MobF family relaxase, partial [Acidimicrobiales bacterium]